VSGWRRLDGAEQLADGCVQLAVVDDVRLAVARHGDTYGALAATCPHAGGPLDEGSLENGLLVCPWHGREFDFRSGHCDGFQAARAYRVEARDGGVFVELPAPAASEATR
jgi:nitrite reductase/ring-hydroxylating ferredoxin subunit